MRGNVRLVGVSMMKDEDAAQAAGVGGMATADELLPLVYDELRRLAASRMSREAEGMTLQPTALVHEAWMRLTRGGARQWNDRAHFFRAAALAMRRILVDRARHKSSLKAGGVRVELDLAAFGGVGEESADERILRIDECLSRLEREDPESARIVVLKFFAGLTNQEVAETLGVTVRTIERNWAYAKACLYEMVREAEAAEEGG
jgi:RNA polymerase sigma factor (TIGR02999 family)